MSKERNELQADKYVCMYMWVSICASASASRRFSECDLYVGSNILAAVLGCAFFTRCVTRVYVVYLQAHSVFAIYICETCTFNETFCEFLINSIAAHVGKGNGKH